MASGGAAPAPAASAKPPRGAASEQGGGVAGEQAACASHAPGAGAGRPQSQDPPDAATAAAAAEVVNARFRAMWATAQRRFSRLRVLPPHGRAHWEPLYMGAFEAHRDVWAFQQRHRAALQEAGLTRADVGEIASKIGQLYYNFYLRTSETKFLLESLTFYEAIRSRGYLDSPPGSSVDIKLASKQLRFYARFVVVCLLLNRHEHVQELLGELEGLADGLPEGADASEWSMVVEEIRKFMWADDKHSLPRTSAPRGLRATPGVHGTFGEAGGFRVRSAILVSYSDQQVKFSTLTLDMYRMLQALEWECEGSPDGEGGAWQTKDAANGSAAPLTPAPAARGAVAQQMATPLPGEEDAGAGGAGGAADARAPGCADHGARPARQGLALINPAKYLMFCPRATQLLQVLSSAVDELPPESALIFYVSAPGLPRPERPPERLLPGDDGALCESGDGPEDAGGQQQDAGARAYQHAGVGLSKDESRQLFPSDLLPFTRKPMLVVVDSDRVQGFAALGGVARGGPVGVLVSPAGLANRQWGSEGDHPDNRGGLFTLFLSGPLHAMVALAGARAPSAQQCAAASVTMERIFDSWENVLQKNARNGMTGVWARFAADPHAFRLIMRFLLCRAAFRLQADRRKRGGKGETRPYSVPQLPPDLDPHAKIVREGVRRIAGDLGIGHAYNCEESPPRPKPKSHYAKHGAHAFAHGHHVYNGKGRPASGPLRAHPLPNAFVGTPALHPTLRAMSAPARPYGGPPVTFEPPPPRRSR